MRTDCIRTRRCQYLDTCLKTSAQLPVVVDNNSLFQKESAIKRNFGMEERLLVE